MTSNGKRIDRTSTINAQQKDQEHYTNQDNYYNNIITTRTRACSTEELPGREIMEQIGEAYRANVSDTITQAAAKVIEDALRAGMEPAHVIMAIEETGLASRPSPYYLRAVLRNWAEYGIVTSRARDKWTTTKARPWWR